MILRDYWCCNDPDFWHPARIGALDKGKVHCSCWICRKKSYDNPSISDKRKHVSADQSILIYLEGADYEQASGQIHPQAAAQT